MTTTIADAHNIQGKNLLTFLKKYQPDEPGTWKHSEWVEDVRKIGVGAQATFYILVDRGELRDDGFPFLRSAITTFDDFTIAEGPEAPNYLQEMEAKFFGPKGYEDTTDLVAYALRALAWQMEGVMDGLGNIQDRLQEANNQ